MSLGRLVDKRATLGTASIRAAVVMHASRRRLLRLRYVHVKSPDASRLAGTNTFTLKAERSLEHVAEVF